MMTKTLTSPAERHAELTDSQLLCRLLDLDTPARTAPPDTPSGLAKTSVWVRRKVSFSSNAAASTKM